MEETDLHIFIRGAEGFFENVTQERAESGVAWLKGEESVILDYTGIIGISGVRKGYIYITTTRDLLRDLTDIMLSSTEVNEERLMDMAGELANTIAGNARSVFGSEFHISVPIVVAGGTQGIYLRTVTESSFVIPLGWKDHKMYLVIGIE